MNPTPYVYYLYMHCTQFCRDYQNSNEKSDNFFIDREDIKKKGEDMTAATKCERKRINKENKGKMYVKGEKIKAKSAPGKLINITVL